MLKMMDLDGYEGLAIFRIPLDEIVERDKNANVMEPKHFLRLIENVRKDKRLESLPYGHLKVLGDRTIFEIISGHHRVRAARQAGVAELYCLTETSTLPDSKVRSKQLAHNKLHGYDDMQLVEEIYKSIDDVNERIATGFNDADFDLDLQSFSGDTLTLDFELKQITFLFLPSEVEDLQAVMDALEGDYEQIYLSHVQNYNKFLDLLRRISQKYKIKSISGQLAKLIDIGRDHLKGADAQVTENQ